MTADSARESAPVLGVLYCPTCELEEASGEVCPRDGTRLVRLASARDPLIGRNLDDRFTIEAKLGAGGMGAVYRARQHSVGRDVAIKLVHPGLVTDPLATKRFLREAKLASRLSHPNVVSVLDFGQTSDGLFYLVMELVQGRTLHDALLDGGRLTLDRVVRIVSQLCDALEGAHALPIMHRDLKPGNIMLLTAGRDLVKVLDFGLAKSLAVDATSTTMTSAGALLGTPTFMPPEVANGEPYDERADLYSLGCILYLLVAGRPPFVTDSVPEMIALHGTAIPEPVTNVPWAFAQVIEKLLRKNPADRYPSAVAVRTAIEEALEAARAPGAAKADSFDGPLPEIVIAARARKAAERVPTDPPIRPSEERMTSRRVAVAPPAEISADLAPEPSAGVVPVTAAPSVTLAARSRGARIAVPLVLFALAVVAVVVIYAATRGHEPPPPKPTPALIAPRPDAAIVVTPTGGTGTAAAVDAAPPPAAPDAGRRHGVPATPPHAAPRSAHADAGVAEADAPF